MLFRSINKKKKKKKNRTERVLEREDSLNDHLHPNKKWRRAAYYSTEASCCLRVGSHMTKYDFIFHNMDRRRLSFPQLTDSFVLVFLRC